MTIQIILSLTELEKLANGVESDETQKRGKMSALC